MILAPGPREPGRAIAHDVRDRRRATAADRAVAPARGLRCRAAMSEHEQRERERARARRRREGRGEEAAGVPGRTTRVVGDGGGLLRRFDAAVQRAQVADERDAEARRQRELGARPAGYVDRDDLVDPAHHPDDPDAAIALGTGRVADRSTHDVGVTGQRRVADVRTRTAVDGGIHDQRRLETETTTLGGLTREHTVATSDVVESRDLRAITRDARAQLTAHRDAARRNGEPGDAAAYDAELARLDGTPDEAVVREVIARQRLAVRDATRADGTTDTTATTRGPTGTSTERTRTTARADGSSRAVARRDAETIDWREGRLASEQRVTMTATDADGRGHGCEARRSTSLDAGGGALRLGREATSSTTETRDGETVASQSTTREGHGSLIDGEDGTGLGAGGSAAATARAGEAELTGRASADGSFVVDVDPVPDTVPRRWQVTLRVAAELGARLSTQRSAREGDAAAAEPSDRAARVSASAHLGARGSAGLTFSHELDEAAARAYLGRLETVDRGGDGGDAAEFRMIARVRAGLGAGDDAAGSALAAFGSADAAAALAPGAAVELDTSGTLEAGGTLGLDGGGLGAGVTAAGSATWTRRVRIERVAASDDAGVGAGARLVDVTVTLSRARSGSLGATASAWQAEMGITESRGDTESLAVTFRLDAGAADYGARYAEVSAIADAEALRRASTTGPLAARVRHRTDGDSATEGRTITAGALGVGIAVTGTGTVSENITTTAAGTSGTVDGTRELGAALRVGDVDVLQDRDRDRARARVDADAGLALDLDQEHEHSTFGDSVAAGAGAVRDWAAELAGGERNPAEAAAELATTSPLDRLEAQLEETATDVITDELSPADVALIARRAADERKWNGRCLIPGALPAWRALRRALVRGAPAIEQARQIAAFTAAYGHEPIRGVIHQWPFAEAEEVGRQLEWPDSLAAERTRYLAARDAIQDARRELEPMRASPDGAVRMRAWRDRQVQALDRVWRAVDRSTAVESVGGKAQLYAACAELRRAADVAYRVAAGVEAAQSADGPAMSGPAPVMSTPATEPETDARHLRVNELIATLMTFKGSERAAFARARDQLDTWLPVNGDEVSSAMNRMEDSIDAWIAAIRELRALYTELSIPPAMWMVSRGPGEPRNAVTEPDVETRIALHEQAGQPTLRQPYAAWRRQAASY
jgi:hypothetical protein